jgi:diadenosine tetraphosphate (Ap4A) HIT family hydrolase
MQDQFGVPETLIHRRVREAQAGTNPTVVCRVSSGWAVLGDEQFLRGYSLLLPDPVVPDPNALGDEQRKTFLYEMTVVGDALQEVTGAYRINYCILGNTEPALHAHVQPRYLEEPLKYRVGPVWNYPKLQQRRRPFDPERDRELMEMLAAGIRRRLGLSING